MPTHAPPLAPLAAPTNTLAHAQSCAPLTGLIKKKKKKKKKTLHLPTSPSHGLLVDRNDLLQSLLNVLRIMPAPILITPQMTLLILSTWDVNPNWDLPSLRANA